MRFALGVWQLNHPRRIFLDWLAAIGALAELRQQIFQHNRVQLIQFVRADFREDIFEQPPLKRDRTRRIFCLPLQPAAGVGFKCHFTVLAVALPEQTFQSLSLVINVLLDTALRHAFRNLNRLCLTDFPAVGTVTITDGDFIFSVK